ncbi:hypothetical protein [Hydrogenophaga sp. PAMC20947]|uniref:hypothetical protein n=1 Tax=Hydrogenophaga sp. PAMC20947 TaxID=2565558 RepID=UPI00109E2B74|nr:hypothetical protein [Hydrogenophaga sp. PAMC20947]QCB45406.1 hypothetical protein E5678_04795 [Hydrogenophaga sp. PAMC20947]
MFTQNPVLAHINHDKKEPLHEHFDRRKVGTMVLAIVGFSWNIWVIGGKAEATVATRAEPAMVEALAPVCQRDATLDANLMARNKVVSWEQRGFVEKDGGAAVVDSNATVQMPSVAKPRTKEGLNVKESKHAR